MGFVSKVTLFEGLKVQPEQPGVVRVHFDSGWLWRWNEAVATFSMTPPTALQSVSNLKEEGECSARVELNKPVVNRQLCTWSWADVMLMGFGELCKDLTAASTLQRILSWVTILNTTEKLALGKMMS